MKTKYTIIKVSKGWQISRPARGIVNGVTFVSFKAADKWLDLLVALGYCTK